MENLTVSVRNPYALREALTVALEVAWPDLAPEVPPGIRTCIAYIPAVIIPQEMHMDTGHRDAFLACISYFRRSRTYHWLREDFCDALRDLEKCLRGE